jgi:hypothetical protein
MSHLLLTGYEDVFGVIGNIITQFKYKNILDALKSDF